MFSPSLERPIGSQYPPPSSNDPVGSLPKLRAVVLPNDVCGAKATEEVARLARRRSLTILYYSAAVDRLQKATEKVRQECCAIDEAKTGLNNIIFLHRSTGSDTSARSSRIEVRRDPAGVAGVRMTGECHSACVRDSRLAAAPAAHHQRYGTVVLVLVSYSIRL